MSMLAVVMSSDGLMPHGFCYQWKPTLVWLHVISDILIALAYFSIPLALIYLVRRRRDIPFGWMFVCFSVFIAACGATHVMDVWTLWIPSYWFSGGVKLLTAIASVPTAVFLVRLMPTILSLPSPEKMSAANEELNRQSARLKKTEERFSQMAENIREIFWIMDPQSKGASYVSPAFESICELPLDSLYSNPTAYRELIHPMDRPRVLMELENLERTNHFDEEFRIVCSSGAVKWLRAIGFSAKDSAGGVVAFVGTAQEITARKEVEVALRESEDRYRDLVEHSTDLICTHDLEGRLLSVNELPVKLLGYSREEFLSRPMRDFLPPEGRAQFDESLLTIQRAGFVKGLMVVLTKAGERRIWEYHNTLRTEGVSVPVVRGIAHDITEQRRLEKALRLSEEKFAKAFRSSPVEIVITTLQEGLVLDVNEAFERNTGFTRNEAIGRTTIELGLWDNPDERAATMGQIGMHGSVKDQEIRFRTKDSRPRVKRYSAEQIEIGGKQCLLAVCEDITERKGAQDALRKTEEHFRAILNHSPNMIFLKDVEGRYVLVNEEYRKAFNIPRDQICGKTDDEIFPPDQAAAFRGSDLRVLHARAPMEFEEEAIHEDGPHTSIVQKFPLFDGSGEVYAICGFVTDITERKRTEEELRRLSGRLLRLQDEERRSIARDLHDSTGQNLVALTAMLDQVRGSIPRTSRKSRKFLADCQTLADQCIREVRTLSYVLHPPLLDEAGLEDALRHYTDGFAKRSGIHTDVDVSPNFGRVRQDIELALFRVVQESLTNIQRHSGTTKAKIRLERHADEIKLEIGESGDGTDRRKLNASREVPFEIGVGIPSMQERMKLIGGRLEILSDGSAITVRATAPAGVENHEAASHPNS